MKKAQSMLEYVITLTVIIAAIIAASSYLKGQVETGLNTAADSIVSSLSGETSDKSKSSSGTTGDTSGTAVDAGGSLPKPFIAKTDSTTTQQVGAVSTAKVETTVNDIFTADPNQNTPTTTDVGGNINMPTAALNSAEGLINALNPGTTKKEE